VIGLFREEFIGETQQQLDRAKST